MKTFACDRCDHALFFESDTCVGCQRRLGFAPDAMTLVALDLVSGSDGDPAATYGTQTRPLDGRTFRRCKNDLEHGACNWLVDAAADSPYCLSCSLNELVPDLESRERRDAWRNLERWKRRMLYSISALGLPIESRGERPDGLCFRLVEGTAEAPVTTGHDEGIITINLAEARPAYREEMKEKLGERYRTALGHFRHEVGHYYWNRIVATDPERLNRFRERFGDERESYEQALERHYGSEPPSGWQQTHVSAYATMHPWEDWAETWAHYLHAIDTLETAQSYGLVVGEPGRDGPINARGTRRVDFSRFDQVADAWYALSLLLNSLNQSMGLADAYPFAPSPMVREKLQMVHDFVREAATGPTWVG